jgi:hypothetical protein
MEEGWRNVRHGKNHGGYLSADETNPVQGTLSQHDKAEERWIEATVGGRLTLIRNSAYVSGGIHRFVTTMPFLLSQGAHSLKRIQQKPISSTSLLAQQVPSRVAEF